MTGSSVPKGPQPRAFFIGLGFLRYFLWKLVPFSRDALVREFNLVRARGAGPTLASMGSPRTRLPQSSRGSKAAHHRLRDQETFLTRIFAVR